MHINIHMGCVYICGIDIGVTHSCPTLCDPMDCSLPGSSVHGIFQARVLEWVTIAFSRRSSWPRDQSIVGRCFTVWATREVCVYIYIHTHIYINEQFPGNISRIWVIKSNFFSFSFVLSLVSPIHRVLQAQRGLIPALQFLVQEDCTQHFSVAGCVQKCCPQHHTSELLHPALQSGAASTTAMPDP